MPTYRIAGKTVRTAEPLTEAQIEEIAADIQETAQPSAQMAPQAPQQPVAPRMGVNPDVPTQANLAPFTGAPDPRAPLGQRIKETAISTLPEFGATAGGVAGFALGGPLGAVAGAGLGGSAGAVLEDIVRKEASDFKDILIEGGTQAAFEAGGGLVARVGGQLVRFAPDVLRAFNITNAVDPAIAAKQLLERGAPQAPIAGTTESLQATQQLLAERGGTLSKAQTGLAGTASRFMENIGRIGLTGSGRFELVQQKNQQIIQDALNNVVEGVSGRVRDPSEIGELYIDTLNAGRRALSAQYGEGLDAVKNNFGNAAVNVRAIKTKAQQALDDASSMFDESGASLLEPETQRILQDIVTQSDTVPAIKLLEFLKVTNQRSAELLDPAGKGYNSIASAQVEEFLENNFRPFVAGQLERINPKAFETYSSLNRSYSQSKNALSPELLKAVARKGKREDFVGVGQALFGTSNKESVKKAFAALAEAKRLNPELNTLEATDALRQGYLTQLIGGQNREFANIVKAERQLNNNANMQSMFNEVLGVSATPVRKLINAATDVSDKPSEGFLGLLLRGKEAQSLAALGTLYAGESAAGLAGIGGALALLSTPAVFARISTNPKAVTKLLNINKASKSMAPQALSSALIRFGNEFGIDIEGQAGAILESDRQFTEQTAIQ
jgi:hypothetical protein